MESIFKNYKDYNKKNKEFSINPELFEIVIKEIAQNTRERIIMHKDLFDFIFDIRESGNTFRHEDLNSGYSNYECKRRELNGRIEKVCDFVKKINLSLFYELNDFLCSESRCYEYVKYLMLLSQNNENIEIESIFQKNINELLERWESLSKKIEVVKGQE